jgi:hypothetical protein
MAGGWLDILRKTIGWKSAKTVERQSSVDASTEFTADRRRTTFDTEFRVNTTLCAKHRKTQFTPAKART